MKKRKRQISRRNPRTVWHRETTNADLLDSGSKPLNREIKCYTSNNGSIIVHERVYSRGSRVWRWALYTDQGQDRLKLRAHYLTLKEAQKSDGPPRASWLGRPQHIRPNPWGESEFAEPLSKRLRRLCRSELSSRDISKYLDVPASWVDETCRTERHRKPSRRLSRRS